MSEERGPWYLLTGLVLGLLLGLAYAWLIRPLEYPDTSPASLQAEFKDQYRVLIASAYLANGNLERARARLELLGDADTERTLAEQAQRTLAEGRSPREAQALGLLAVALGQEATPPAGQLAASGTLTPPAGATGSTLTQVPASTGAATSGPSSGSASATPLPTGTATPVLVEQPFVLEERTLICEQGLGQPLIQVQVSGANREPVPGVEVVVTWESGQDHFFTGLKPDLGLGYADFVMTPGLVYTLNLADGGQPVTDLQAEECETSAGDPYWGAWLLEFEQP